MENGFMKIIFSIIVVIIAAAFYSLGYDNGIGNQEMRYGASGFPKNCRALIAVNVNGVFDEKYSAEEALHSIDRNCGANGYIWNER